MDTGEKLIGLIFGTCSFVASILPGLSLRQRLVSYLVIAFLCLLAYYIKLLCKYKKLKNSFSDKSQKHNALAKQFIEKGIIIERYRLAFENLAMLFSVATQSNVKDKVKNLYDAFLQIQNHVEDRSDNDARDL